VSLHYWAIAAPSLSNCTNAEPSIAQSPTVIFMPEISEESTSLLISTSASNLAFKATLNFLVTRL